MKTLAEWGVLKAVFMLCWERSSFLWRSHFGTQSHLSSAEANIVFIHLVKHFLMEKRLSQHFTKRTWSEWKYKQTICQLVRHFQLDQKYWVNRHTNNNHSLSRPLKCVLRYWKYNFMHQGLVNTNDSVKLDFLATKLVTSKIRCGSHCSIFFLLSHTFPQKTKAKVI